MFTLTTLYGSYDWSRVIYPAASAHRCTEPSASPRQYSAVEPACCEMRRRPLALSMVEG